MAHLTHVCKKTFDFGVSKRSLLSWHLSPEFWVRSKKYNCGTFSVFFNWLTFSISNNQFTIGCQNAIKANVVDVLTTFFMSQNMSLFCCVSHYFACLKTQSFSFGCLKWQAIFWMSRSPTVSVLLCLKTSNSFSVSKDCLISSVSQNFYFFQCLKRLSHFFCVSKLLLLSVSLKIISVLLCLKTSTSFSVSKNHLSSSASQKLSIFPRPKKLSQFLKSQSNWPKPRQKLSLRLSIMDCSNHGLLKSWIAQIMDCSNHGLLKSWIVNHFC